MSEGGRVAILALNSHRYFEIYYAIPWAGGAIVPLNTRLALPELQYILEDSGAEILIVDDNFVSVAQAITRAAAVAAHADPSIATAAPRTALPATRALLAEIEPVDDAGRSGGDLAGIFYTGGSTGKAKGVMLSHDNLVTNAVNGCYMIGYDPTSVYLHAAPMCYLTDGMSTLSITMAAGTHVFIPRFEVETCLAGDDRASRHQYRARADHDRHDREFAGHRKARPVASAAIHVRLLADHRRHAEARGRTVARHEIPARLGHDRTVADRHHAAASSARCRRSPATG